jgi:hypothetical protein
MKIKYSVQFSLSAISKILLNSPFSAKVNHIGNPEWMENDEFYSKKEFTKIICNESLQPGLPNLLREEGRKLIWKMYC